MSARARNAVPAPVEGYFIPLKDHMLLSTPVTLGDLRHSKANLAEIRESLGAVKRAPVYFPFELSARPVRPLQGYAFKLPAGVVHAFPAMHEAATRLLRPLDDDAIRNAVENAVSAIEASAQPYQISNLQRIRAEAAGRRLSSSRIFGPGLKGKDWTFHHGGRSELQFNVGFDLLENGSPALRAGVGFSFKASRSFPNIDALLPKVTRFNAWLHEHADELSDMKMWSWRGNVRGLNGPPAPISEAMFREGTFAFLGEAHPLSRFDPLAALRAFDRLLPLYQAVEFAGPSGAPAPWLGIPGQPQDDTLQVDKGREIAGGRWITASIKERSLNIFLRHAEIQRRLKDVLIQEGCKKVLCEVPIGSRFVDLVAWRGDAIWMFEIKTGLTVRSCLREALGQLLEYALWPGATRPKRLVVVGTPTMDKKASQYITELNRAFPVPVSYRQVALD
jgi:hypothetical protein